MTTTELVAEIDSLTSAEQKRVGVFIARMKKNRGIHPAIKPLTRAELVRNIKQSHKEAGKGRTKSAFESLENIRKQYGLSS